MVIALLGAVFILLSTGCPYLDDFGYVTYDEAERSSSVKKADSDYLTLENGELMIWPDKLPDVEETYFHGTDPFDPDTDRDGMEDGWEVEYQLWDPVRKKFTIDPLVPDALENPDGDGFDADRNGRINEREALFNLREYSGGAEYDHEHDRFDPDDPIFGGLSPSDDWREIGMRGGFHLYDDPSDGQIGNTTRPERYNDTFDDYLRYDPDLPERYGPVTTNPSLWDTDLDGMDDGWETHYRNELNSYMEFEDIFYQRYILLQSVEEIQHWERDLIDPLNPDDPDLDMDMVVEIKDDLLILDSRPDGLTNLWEYENGTSPLLWDTDGDSYFNFLKGYFYGFDDYTELNTGFDRSNTDWNGDCIIDYRTNPWDPDTDGDGMMDGWEWDAGLNPLNSTDRLRDLDRDGLPNYLENAFPNATETWFQTDPRNPDSDDDGILDGWEAYNARIISREKALNTREDMLDKIPDGWFTIYSVNPMIPDSLDDNDGWVIESDDGGITFTPDPDGISNWEEWVGTVHYPVSTDPNNPDTDGDGLTDGEEIKYGFPGELVSGYYLTTQNRSRYFTNATLSDSDMDFGGSGIIDQRGNLSRSLDDWEEINGRTKDPMPRNGLDDDGDGLIDEGEYLVFPCTNATNPDSDMDGWYDVDEIFGIDTKLICDDSRLGHVRTDPTVRDTDGDGLDDFHELNKLYLDFHKRLIDNEIDHRGYGLKDYLTDPNDHDSDDDGLSDGTEENTDFLPFYTEDPKIYFDPSDPYYDWIDIESVFGIQGSDPNDPDTDGDGLPDGWEYEYGMVTRGGEFHHLYRQLMDSLGIHEHYCAEQEWPAAWIINPLISTDVYDDPDRDELTNLEEYQRGTHPLKADTDGDGMPDGWELDEKNRGRPVYDPDLRGYRWLLDPLNPDDWWYDGDHDGYTYEFWTEINGTGIYELVSYYFPFINLYEYQCGLDSNHDGINDITYCPAPRIMELYHFGGYNTDGDHLPDGWEVWLEDDHGNFSNGFRYADNDSLPMGWEEFFNGSMWNRPECRPYEMIMDDDDFIITANTLDMSDLGSRILEPKGFENGIYRTGCLYPNRKDTDINGLLDGREDFDWDGFDNLQEYENHTDPWDPGSYPGHPGMKIPGQNRSCPSRSTDSEACELDPIIENDESTFNPIAIPSERKEIPIPVGIRMRISWI
ncbi:MAG: hypothetical protein ACMUIG_02595 [Thermoplasmatota archaeon]